MNTTKKAEDIQTNPGTSEQALISGDFGEYGGYIKIKNVKDLESWLQSEIKGWSEYLVLWAIRDLQSLVSLYQSHFSKMKSIIVRLKELDEYKNQSDILEAREGISVELDEAFGLYSKKAIASTQSKIGTFIRSLEERKPTLGGYALLSFLDIFVRPGTGSSSNLLTEGLLAKNIYLFGMIDRTEIERKDLKVMRDTWLQSFEDIESEASLKIEELNSIKLRLAKHFESEEKLYAEWLNQNQMKLNLLEETYNQKLALEAPAKYWLKERKSHLVVAWISGVVLVLYATVGVYYLDGAYKALLTTENVLPWQIWIALLKSIVFGSVGVIIIKFLLSRIHLSSDAKARSVMANTYLAMSRDGQIFKEDDRHLILSPLFTTPRTGLIKVEDGQAPTKILERFIDP